MSQQTNRIPSGFLDLVGAETGGKTPAQYGDVLSASVDLTELFAGQTLCANGQGISHTSAGNSFQFEIPNEEAWLLRGIGYSCPFSSLTHYEQWQIGVWQLPRQEYGNDVGWLHSTSKLEVVAGGQTANFTYWFESPVLLLPGCELYWQLRQRDAGTARNATLTHMFNLLRVGGR